MRTEARIKTSIWEDADFLALPDQARLAYLFAISQRDIELCGYIPYRPARWVSRLGWGIDELEAALGQLQTAGFVVIDFTEQELWVRTFMRHDHVKGDRQLAAARNYFAVVNSAKIRAAFAAEYPTLAEEWGLDTLSDTLSDTPRRTEVGGRRTEVGGNARTVDSPADQSIAPLASGPLDPEEVVRPQGPNTFEQDGRASPETVPSVPIRGFYPRDLLRFAKPAEASA